MATESDSDYEVMQMFCQKCGKEVFPHDFRSDSALRSFMMWGKCQECQDEERGRELLKGVGT